MGRCSVTEQVVRITHELTGIKVAILLSAYTDVIILFSVQTQVNSLKTGETTVIRVLFV